MSKELIAFIVLAVIFLIITLFLKTTLNKFNKTFNARLTENEENVTKLREFSYDLYFKNPPNEIVVENPDDCTPSELKECILDNPYSCAGCKSLISTCVNFPKDTKYIDYNGKEIIIPKNKTANDGYCLTQKNPEQACNPYHGDLVLIQTDPNSLESMLYCECKNPGYIGNAEVNGACNEVFICDGKIDNINKPLEDINCICNDDESPTTISNTPVCTKAIVKTYDKYDDGVFYNNIETISIDRFTGDIIKGFPGKELRNPCKYCLITGEYIENGTMVVSDDGWQCALINAKTGIGLPIRRNPNYRILKGTAGPDGIINIKLESVIMQGFLFSTDFEQMTAKIKVSDANNKKILQRMGMEIVNPYVYINLKGHELVFPGSFGELIMMNTPAVVCDGHIFPGWADDLFYTCYFDNFVPTDRVPKHYELTNVTWNVENQPLLITQSAPKCPKPSHNIFTGAVFKDWKRLENLNPSYYIKTHNQLNRYHVWESFKQNSEIRYIMFLHNFNFQYSTFFGTMNMDAFNTWKRNLIPIEDEDIKIKN